MNERMYELISQCFIGTTDGKLSELNTVANVEKFAKLVIRECIQSIRPYDASGHFEDTIREHFYGVG